jgi:hypothetical protein
MQSNVIEQNIGLDRRRFACARDGERLGSLYGFRFLCGFPLQIGPLQRIINSAHIPRSFCESAMGVKALETLAGRECSISPCIAEGEIVNGC